MEYKATDLINSLWVEFQQQQETRILEQLRWLVDREILVIHQTTPTLVELPDKSFQIHSSVELKVREHEYIDRLEQKIATLERRIVEISNR